jgi:polyisoprenoid-binding protein YceI
MASIPTNEVADGLKPGLYKPDPAHTIVGFEARHMVFTKVRGR